MKQYYEYEGNRLMVDGLCVRDIAETYGTPLYIYSQSAFLERYREVREAYNFMPTTICFSTKANGNLAVLKSLVAEGAGLDVVSGGELRKALEAGCASEKIVFAGVGKTTEEIRFAIQSKIKMFDVESVEELEHIQQVAEQEGMRAAVALRVNPDTDAQTHAYITTGSKENKFGIAIPVAREVLQGQGAYPSLDFIGLHVHIGSQITKVSPFVEALTKVKTLLLSLKEEGVSLSVLNIGGGVGIAYEDTPAIAMSEVVEAIRPILEECPVEELVCEPGRYIAGNSGILVGQVILVKHTNEKKFVITDASMTDLLRPMLYQAYHRVESVTLSEERMEADIVGPVCESGDCFGKGRDISVVTTGDYVSIFSAGAYGHVMASRYNMRSIPAEVMVVDGKVRVVGERETYETMIQRERV